ncbi:MAG: radical SAM protein [Candidatus Hydrogenedentes bacterium]|nr:radical SAM protein [Candidatus Hydrogenedentota bacterium]
MTTERITSPISDSPAANDPRTATLAVTEIYKSVQGESTWAGLPCTFIRLTGCNLRCVWCDTEYAFHGGAKMTLDQIVAQCDALDCALIEITGGEPLLQKGCGALAQLLLDNGYTVLCETSGSLPIDRMPDQVIKIMDLKCPDSGEAEKNDWTNVARLSSRDEVKFVIASRNDYEWSRDVVRAHDLPSRCKQVLFSPVFGSVDPKDIVEWILEDRLDVRFQLQLHKFIWPPQQRGV